MATLVWERLQDDCDEVGIEPPPLYHGTRSGFRGRGGLVLPRSTTGSKPTTAPLANGTVVQVPGSDEWVYVTPVLRLAWVYAWHSGGRGCPRVLTVVPSGEFEPDPEHGGDMAAYRCKAAHVIRVDFDSPITEGEARSGWILDEIL